MGLHWRGFFYLCFFLYTTTVRNNFCSSILIIALCSFKICVCVVCSFTQLYTLTQHIRTFDLLYCVSCPRLSNVLDRLIKSLKSSATKTRQASESSRVRLLTLFWLFSCAAGQAFWESKTTKEQQTRECAHVSSTHTDKRIHAGVSCLFVCCFFHFHFSIWVLECRRWGRAVVDTRSRNRSRQSSSCLGTVCCVCCCFVFLFRSLAFGICSCCCSFCFGCLCFFPTFD